MRVTAIATSLIRVQQRSRAMMTLDQFNAALETGPYAWPGGYPCYFVMADGAAVSFKAAKAMADTIREYISDDMPASSGWRPAAVNVNWEDPDLICDHTGERIESAYAEDGQ